jgi:hypothetical protein
MKIRLNVHSLPSLLLIVSGTGIERADSFVDQAKSPINFNNLIIHRRRSDARVMNQQGNTQFVLD